jgi:hypothetical protein
MYIPFASLLGLQAALEPLVHKQLAPEAAFIDGVDFVDPRPGGGSLLDHDSGSGLGEPLNVSLPNSAALTSLPLPFLLTINKMQVIISGQSSEWALADGGFVHFANALGL